MYSPKAGERSLCFRAVNRVFSRDVTAAMLVSLNKGKAAMLVSPINPPGIEFYSYAFYMFPFVLVEKHVHWSRE